MKFKEDKMKRKQLAALLSGILMLGMFGCEYVTIEPKDVVIPVTPVDFATEIEPIFTTVGCTECHNGSIMFSLAAGKAYASLISRNLVDTVNPANSNILKKIAPGHNNKTFTAEQSALILKWITEGAKGAIIPVSYKNEVEPLWTSLNCTMCHGGSQLPDLRVGKSYASLISTNAVIAKNPAGSKLIQKINEKHNGAGNLTAAQKDLVTTWIVQGALNN